MSNIFSGFAIFVCRNDLQKAIEDEDYGGAAELRDQISKLEVSLLS
jgi:protein-arginine kinase activator protein McsA